MVVQFFPTNNTDKLFSMHDNLTEHESRTIALAGVFRAAALANRLANEGEISNQDLTISVNSIFSTNPENALEVFGKLENLHQGFKTLSVQMAKETQRRDMDIARYVVSMLFLERKLVKNPEMLKTLSDGIDLAKRQSEHFEIIHENVIANLADLYTQTISKLGPRIMVSGDERYLTQSAISNRIRTVLLAGIRSAVLWQQMGGRRWQIIFSRAKYRDTAEQFLN